MSMGTARHIIDAIASRIGRVRAPFVSDRDRVSIVRVLFPASVCDRVSRPAGRTFNDILSSSLHGSDFERWVVAPIRQGDKAVLAAAVDAEMVAWARVAFPLEDATKGAIADVSTRGDLLSLLFGDAEFLKAVKPEAGWRWAPSLFLKGKPPSETTRNRLRTMIDNQSGLLDPTWLEHWGASLATSIDDLYRLGLIRTFKSNGVFDRDFYRIKYNTESTNYFDDLVDYVYEGEKKDRAPNAFVNVRSLRFGCHHALAEIHESRISCLLDYLVKTDKRDQILPTFHFDPVFYGSQLTADERRDCEWSFSHYVNAGWREGLEPNPCFDQLWYLRTYPAARDAVEEGVWPNAFSHFVMEGEDLGYRPCAFFDAHAYTRVNKDIANADFISPFRHFWQYGRFEHRAFGLPQTATVARYFYQRFPVSLDVVSGGALTRSSGKPSDVLDLSRTPAKVGDVVSLLASVSGGPADSMDVEQQILDPLFEALARPIVRIEVGRDQNLFQGDTTRLYLSGLASLGGVPLIGVRVLSGPSAGACEFYRYPRLDELEVAAIQQPSATVLQSGFMAWFEMSTAELGIGDHAIDIQFQFRSQERSSPVVWHETILLTVLERPRPSTSHAACQVAMATYNPPGRPLKRQIDTILQNPGVHILISDDASPTAGALALASQAERPELSLDFGKRNLNFVRNFERSLHMRSASVRTLLFSDQDDAWYPHKVGTLQAYLTPGVSCAFSDMRIVKKDGEIVSETFWTGRSVHFNDPLTLAVANTVTGAAAAFPAEITDLLTPFPMYMGLYHDQWLAVLASAVGQIAYHPEPLYDYVQHGSNVLGFSGSRAGNERHWKAVVKSLRRAMKCGYAEPRDLAYVEMALASTIPLLQRFVLLNEALRRAPVWKDAQVRDLTKSVVDLMAGKSIDIKGTHRSWLRLKRRAGGDEALLNIDDMFMAIFVSRALLASGVVSAYELRDALRIKQQAWDRQVERDSDPEIGLLERKTARIRLDIKPDDVALRVTMFLPELQLATFFGGYHSKISLITRLAERGIKTRIILLDQPSVDHAGIARIIGAFPELETGLMSSEIEAHGSREGILDVTPRDVLVATTWWSAHVVNDIRLHLGRDKFLYFVQEYEPFTFELGTNYRAAELTYELPHDAVFSTEILEDFFRRSSAGVFAPSAVANARSMVFRNPITGLKDTVRKPLAGRRPRLLFYARPQSHAARNMYEFGLAALREAVTALGDELKGWELIGVGANEAGKVRLSPAHELRLIGKLDAQAYRETLAESDVGLALMYTPHPSLVPLEMAAAGLLTVTNACMTKRKEAFAEVSSLIDVADPDVGSIAKSIVSAVRRVNQSPIDHHPIDWPVNPAQAFSDAWLDQFVQLAEESTGLVG